MEPKLMRGGWTGASGVLAWRSTSPCVFVLLSEDQLAWPPILSKRTTSMDQKAHMKQKSTMMVLVIEVPRVGRHHSVSRLRILRSTCTLLERAVHDWKKCGTLKKARMPLGYDPRIGKALYQWCCALKYLLHVGNENVRVAWNMFSSECWGHSNQVNGL